MANLSILMLKVSLFIHVIFAVNISLVNAKIGDPCEDSKECSAISSDCLGGICACKPGYSLTMDGTTEQCSTKLKLLKNCTEADECITEHSHCWIPLETLKQPLCFCDPGYSLTVKDGLSNARCKIDPKSLKDTCTDDLDCKVEQSYCKFGICTCKQGYSAELIAKACTKIILLGMACNSTDHIKVEHASCIDGTAQCDPGYETLGSRCRLDERFLNQTCSEDSDCKLQRSSCDDSGACMCEKKYIAAFVPSFNKIMCMEKKYVGMNCTDIDVIDIEHASCIDGTVQCLSGYAPLFRSECLISNASLGDPCKYYPNCITPYAKCKKRICSCENSKYFGNGTEYCTQSFGDKCTTSLYCPSKTECVNGYCRCGLGYKYDYTTNLYDMPCVKDDHSLLVHCNKTEDCTWYRSSCDRNQCRCSRFSNVFNTSSGLVCRKTVPHGRKCIPEDIMKLGNSHCKDGTVSCQDNYIYKLDTKYNLRCLHNVGIDQGQKCDADFQCLRNTKKSVCKTVCTCKDEYSIDVVRNATPPICAKPILKVYRLCSDTEICMVENGHCKEGFCECKEGYESEDDRKSCYLPWYHTIGRTGMIIMFVILAFIGICILVALPMIICKYRNNRQSMVRANDVFNMKSRN